MPERYNFVTETFDDLRKGEDLVEEMKAFCHLVTLHKFNTYFDGDAHYFISGQAIEEDSNAAPLELKMLFDGQGLTVVFVNDTETGVIKRQS